MRDSGPVELATYLEHVEADGASLRAAARLAPHVPVPTCPDWDMTGLLGHTAVVHHWVAEIVRTKATERPAKQFSRDMPTEIAATLAWYDEGLADLLDQLVNVDPDEQVWNWSAGRPAPARFWHRRMAAETVVHRWDAEAAAGEPQPVDTTLAVDGIDEYLGFMAGGNPFDPIEGLSGSLHLHATDCEGEWLVSLESNRIEHREGHAKADAALRGSASDLFLWLINRRPADWPGLEVFGDRQIIDSWRLLKF